MSAVEQSKVEQASRKLTAYTCDAGVLRAVYDESYSSGSRTQRKSLLGGDEKKREASFSLGVHRSSHRDDVIQGLLEEIDKGKRYPRVVSKRFAHEVLHP